MIYRLYILIYKSYSFYFSFYMTWFLVRYSSDTGQCKTAINLMLTHKKIVLTPHILLDLIFSSKNIYILFLIFFNIFSILCFLFAIKYFRYCVDTINYRHIVALFIAFSLLYVLVYISTDLSE